MPQCGVTKEFLTKEMESNQFYSLVGRMEAESDAGARGFGPIVVTTLGQQTPNWDLKIGLQC